MNMFSKILGTLMLLIVGWLVTKYTARMLWWANGDGMSFTGIVLSWVALFILIPTWISIHFGHKRI